MTWARSLPLFWQVTLTNFLVFVAGTLVLAFSPVTVSERVRTTEALVLTVGLLVMMTVNGMLLRSVLRPLDRLTETMREIDLRSPGLRLEDPGVGPAAALVEGFNEMLDRLEQERGTSTARAVTAQEAERTRIAQELHDEVGQSLTVVLLGLHRALEQAGPPVAEELAAAQETVRASLDEVRRISQRLRPGMLDDLGLQSSLASLAGELTRAGGPSVTRSFAPGLPTLDRVTELVVYRVAQEALTNVGRHARASLVELGLTRQGGTVVLRVADDGRGLPHDFVEGAGLRGMRERAAMVGGSLQVRRRDGGGTEVLLVVPVATP